MGMGAEAVDEKAKKSISRDNDPLIRKSTSAITACDATPVAAAKNVTNRKMQKARSATERFIGYLSQLF
jgi:hypothetical protein